MSKAILHRHELRVIFEEDEDTVVHWRSEIDDRLREFEHHDTATLTRLGAPLAATGIQALHQLLCTGFIELALNRADNHRWRALFEQINQTEDDEEISPEQLALH